MSDIIPGSIIVSARKLAEKCGFIWKTPTNVVFGRDGKPRYVPFRDNLGSYHDCKNQCVYRHKSYATLAILDNTVILTCSPDYYSGTATKLANDLADLVTATSLSSSMVVSIDKETEHKDGHLYVRRMTVTFKKPLAKLNGRFCSRNLM